MNKYPYIPVFWSGKHLNKGDKKEWTPEDVRRIFSSTITKTGKIPFTIDHPKNDLPVIGYTDNLNVRLIEDGLKSIIEVQPTDFAEDILKQVKESGRKKISIALAPDDYSIRHIGLVEKPAVKDLPAIPFEQNSDTINFELEGDEVLFMDWETAWRFQNIGSMFSDIRDYFIEKEGLEKANEIMQRWTIDELLKTKETPATATANNLFNIKGDNPMNPMADNNNPDNTALLQFEQENSQLKAELETLKAEQQAIKHEKKLLEFKQYLADQHPGRVTPAMQSKVLRIMDSLDGQAEYEFTEDDNTIKTTPLEEFKALLFSLPEQLKFGEYAVNGTAGSDGTDFQDAIFEAFNKSRVK